MSESVMWAASGFAAGALLTSGIILMSFNRRIRAPKMIRRRRAQLPPDDVQVILSDIKFNREYRHRNR